MKFNTAKSNLVFSPPVIKRGVFRISCIAMIGSILSSNVDAQLIARPPSLLNSNALTDTSEDFFPKIACDKFGNCIVVWNSIENRGTGREDMDVFFASSSDSGNSWTRTASLMLNPESDKYNDSFPCIATDGQGNWIAAWTSVEVLNDGTKDADIFFARSTDNGKSWSPSAVLNSPGSNDGAEDSNVQINGDANGHWMASWRVRGNQQHEFMISGSANGGLTWTQPIGYSPEGFSKEEHLVPWMITNKTGEWWTSWEYRNGDDHALNLVISTDQGASWGKKLQFNAGFPGVRGMARLVFFQTDPNGHIVAVWQFDPSSIDSNGDQKYILVSRSSDSGETWSTPKILNKIDPTQSTRDVNPQILYDSKDTWVVVWNEIKQVETSKRETSIIGAYSIDAGKTWSEPVSLVPDNKSRARGVAQVAHVGGNQWVAVWSEATEFGGKKNADLMVTTFTVSK
jgi:hypothetical protein